MVFLVDEICTKMTFLPLGATLCPSKSYVTDQIHVELILTNIVLAKALQQPILGPTAFWIIKT